MSTMTSAGVAAGKVDVVTAWQSSRGSPCKPAEKNWQGNVEIYAAMVYKFQTDVLRAVAMSTRNGEQKNVIVGQDATSYFQGQFGITSEEARTFGDWMIRDGALVPVGDMHVWSGFQDSNTAYRFTWSTPEQTLQNVLLQRTPSVPIPTCHQYQEPERTTTSDELSEGSYGTIANSLETGSAPPRPSFGSNGVSPESLLDATWLQADPDRKLDVASRKGEDVLANDGQLSIEPNIGLKRHTSALSTLTTLRRKLDIAVTRTVSDNYRGRCDIESCEQPGPEKNAAGLPTETSSAGPQTNHPPHPSSDSVPQACSMDLLPGANVDGISSALETDGKTQTWEHNVTSSCSASVAERARSMDETSIRDGPSSGVNRVGSVFICPYGTTTTKLPVQPLTMEDSLVTPKSEMDSQSSDVEPSSRPFNPMSPVSLLAPSRWSRQKAAERRTNRSMPMIERNEFSFRGRSLPWLGFLRLRKLRARSAGPRVSRARLAEGDVTEVRDSTEPQEPVRT